MQVELLQIDDFEKSRDAFRAGGDKGGVDIMWSTVDAYALEYGGLSKLNPKAIMQYDWSRGGDAIAVDASIKSVADLQAASGWPAREATPSHYFALYVLTQGGLTNQRRELGLHRLGGGRGQRLQGGQGGRRRLLVARRVRGRARAPGGHILASHQGGQQPRSRTSSWRAATSSSSYPRTCAASWPAGCRASTWCSRTRSGRRVLLQKSLTGVNTLEDAKGMLEDVKLPDYRREPRVLRPAGLARQLPQRSTRRAQGIWRKIGKISDVYQPHQTVDTRFLDGVGRVLPRSGRPRPSPSSSSSSPPKPAARAHPDQDRLHLLP